MIALAYKDGVSVDTLSDRYAILRLTLYWWLDRFEELPIDEAIQVEARPGRPPALTEAERKRFQVDLKKPPPIFGFEAYLWLIENLQKHIVEKYVVEYFEGHIRRLLRAFDIEFQYL